MAQTKVFMICGTSNYASEYSIEIELKVNSPKQAQERFLKKYNSILAGYWYFSILDGSKHFKQVGAFEIGKVSESGINKVVKNQTELFNKTVNDSIDSLRSYWVKLSVQYNRAPFNRAETFVHLDLFKTNETEAYYRNEPKSGLSENLVCLLK